MSNPISELVAKANSNIGSGVRMVCVLGIGTENSSTLVPTEPMIVHKGRIEGKATSGEQTTQDTATRIKYPPNHILLPIHQGFHDIPKPGWDQSEAILEHTEAYIQEPEVDANINKIVEALRIQGDPISPERIRMQYFLL